jgi:hypothetical protein
MIIFDGVSRIDNKTHILGILTGVTKPTTNSKTGPMAQLWIIREDMPHGKSLSTPYDGTEERGWPGARPDMMDAAVCGGCPFAAGQGCYVTTQPTASIWKARHSYPRETLDTLVPLLIAQHRRGVLAGLRLGAYGDPVALPIELVEELVGRLESVRNTFAITGYTHAWQAAYRLPNQEAPDPRWKRYLMASCHHAKDSQTAYADGWRPYVILPRGNPDEVLASARAAGVALCPASDEANNRLTCATCGGCDGRRGNTDKRRGFGLALHGGAATLNGGRKTQGQLAE